MGMYTEILIKCNIRSCIGDADRAMLGYMFNAEDEPAVLPDHEFFKTTRWKSVGRGSSHSHIPWTDSCFGGDQYGIGCALFSRSDLKNYDREIELFFDYLRSLASAFPGECIGWQWYEDDDVPTLVKM